MLIRKNVNLTAEAINLNHTLLTLPKPYLQACFTQSHTVLGAIHAAVQQGITVWACIGVKTH
jgi:hypothetical protein